jgi:hypothetical protein
MLKWTKSSDRSGEYYYLHTPLCTYEVRKSGKTKFKALVHGVWMYGHDTENAAIFACELDYASRVHSLARANGYVKLEPGQVVLAQTEARAIYDGNCGECGIGQRKNPPCHGCCMRPIRAALDASGVGR